MRYSLLLLVIGISACVYIKESENRFDKEYQITHSVVELSDIIASEGQMILLDDVNCIVKAEYYEGTLLSKIDYTKRTISPLVKKGNGPNEYNSLIMMNQTEDGHFWVFDIPQKRFLKMTDKGISVDTVVSDLYAFAANNIGDNTIVSGIIKRRDSNYQQTRFALINHHGEAVSYGGNYPDDGVTEDMNTKAFAYQGRFVVNQRLNRFAFFCFSGEMFDLCSVQNGQIIPIKEVRIDLPRYKSAEDNNGVIHEMENRMGYIDVYATNRFMYALFSGRIIDEKSRSGLEKARSTEYIYVYDWDGNAVCKLVADRKLLSICATRDNSRLFGISIDGNDIELCSFDLSLINELK